MPTSSSSVEMLSPTGWTKQLINVALRSVPAAELIRPPRISPSTCVRWKASSHPARCSGCLHRSERTRHSAADCHRRYARRLSHIFRGGPPRRWLAAAVLSPSAVQPSLLRTASCPTPFLRAQRAMWTSRFGRTRSIAIARQPTTPQSLHYRATGGLASMPAVHRPGRPAPLTPRPFKQQLPSLDRPRETSRRHRCQVFAGARR